MKSVKLINALMNGELLEKVYENVQESAWLFYDKEYNSFEMKGWGTAYGNEQDRVIEVLLHPENWKVSEVKRSSYPWAVNPVVEKADNSNIVKEEYNELLKSGMFWEFFPELSGSWVKDKEAFTEFYTRREKGI